MLQQRYEVDLDRRLVEHHLAGCFSSLPLRRPLTNRDYNRDPAMKFQELCAWGCWHHHKRSRNGCRSFSACFLGQLGHEPASKTGFPHPGKYLYLDRFELYLEGIGPVPADRIGNYVASHSAHHLITWCQTANSVEHPQNLPDRLALSFVEFLRVLRLGLYPGRPLQSHRRLIPPEVADKCSCFSRIPRLSCQRAPSGLRHRHRRVPFL